MTLFVRKVISYSLKNCSYCKGPNILIDILGSKIFYRLPPVVSLESCTVAEMIITKLNALSALPLCSWPWTSFWNKPSRAFGDRAAAFGEFDVMLIVFTANDSNLSTTIKHKVRTLLGPSPEGNTPVHSGVSDGGSQTSQTLSLSSPKEYRRGLASASTVHRGAESKVGKIEIDLIDC